MGIIGKSCSFSSVFSVLISVVLTIGIFGIINGGNFSISSFSLLIFSVSSFITICGKNGGKFNISFSLVFLSNEDKNGDCGEGIKPDSIIPTSFTIGKPEVFKAGNS